MSRGDHVHEIGHRRIDRGASWLPDGKRPTKVDRRPDEVGQSQRRFRTKVIGGNLISNQRAFGCRRMTFSPIRP